MKRASVSSLVGYRSKEGGACSIGGFWCLVLGCVALKTSVAVFPAGLNLPKGTKLFRQELSVGHHQPRWLQGLWGNIPSVPQRRRQILTSDTLLFPLRSSFFKNKSHEVRPPSGFRFSVHQQTSLKMWVSEDVLTEP